MIDSRIAVHPEWTSLLEHRFVANAVEPSSDDWAAAMDHFDACAECRRTAVAIDPTLGFRRLPALGAEMSDAQEADEVARMISAVSALRAERRISRSGRASWTRWSAAAALIAASLWVGAIGGRSVRNPSDDAAADFAAAPPSATAVVPASFSLNNSALVVEGVDRPDARVYQLDGDRLSVVMIVDESLDV